MLFSKFTATSLLFLFTLLLYSCGQADPKSVSGPEKELLLPDTFPRPQGSPLELGLAGYAKVLCSAVFISERDPEEAFINSGFFLMPEGFRRPISYSVDWDDQVVQLTIGDTLMRKAKFYGDQGCIICPGNREEVYFEPAAVETRLPPAREQDWPMGDRLSPTSWPEAIDRKALEQAVDLAFTPTEALTAAFLVVYKGQIIAEKYMEGIDKDTQLESWSMGKSLTATLIGRMIQEGYFELDDPAPVPAWQQAGDPRAQIRIRDLLQMSSGLHFTAHRDPEAGAYTEYLDHFYIYTGAVDAFRYAYDRPLQFAVGAEGRYRNCDPLTLGFLMRQALTTHTDYLTYAQRELFDKIGIRRQVMETDPFGNFLLTGYDYGTARNWARLGMLYLQDGLWNGEQLLPPGWSNFVSTPALAWDEPVYGGLFWLNQTGEWKLPADTYYMAGGGGQRTFIVPSLDLVLVRLGHFRGNEVGMKSLNRALEKISAVLPAPEE